MISRRVSVLCALIVMMAVATHAMVQDPLNPFTPSLSPAAPSDGAAALAPPPAAPANVNFNVQPPVLPPQLVAAAPSDAPSSPAAAPAPPAASSSAPSSAPAAVASPPKPELSEAQQDAAIALARLNRAPETPDTKLRVLNNPEFRKLKSNIENIRSQQAVVADPSKLIDRVRRIVARKIDKTIEQGWSLYRKAKQGAVTEQELRDHARGVKTVVKQEPCQKELEVAEAKPLAIKLDDSKRAKSAVHDYSAHGDNPIHQVDVTKMNTPSSKSSKASSAALIEAHAGDIGEEMELPTHAELAAEQAEEAKRPKRCPGCQHIVYNADSPLSAEDEKDLRRQHRKLILTDSDAPLHSQATLDQARVTVWQAEQHRKRIMQKYPPPEDSLLQMNFHN